jgi:hypothetical protein
LKPSDHVCSQRGLKNRSNALVASLIAVVFLASTVLWGLELSRLLALNGVLLSPDGLDGSSLEQRFNKVAGQNAAVTDILSDLQARDSLIHYCFLKRACLQLRWLFPIFLSFGASLRFGTTVELSYYYRFSFGHS